jgi:hypothetical protein
VDLFQQRVPCTQCARCRKQLQPGDRVATAFIVQTVGRNPETRELGAMLGGDFELTHADCKNPQLDPRLVIV